MSWDGGCPQKQLVPSREGEHPAQEKPRTAGVTLSITWSAGFTRAECIYTGSKLQLGGEEGSSLSEHSCGPTSEPEHICST